MVFELQQRALVDLQRLTRHAQRGQRIGLLGEQAGQIGGSLVRFQAPTRSFEMVQRSFQASLPGCKVGQVSFSDRGGPIETTCFKGGDGRQKCVLRSR